MAKSSEETSEQPPAKIFTGKLTVAQLTFAEVVGRELARQWIEQQSPSLNERERQMVASLSSQNLARESSPCQP